MSSQTIKERLPLTGIGTAKASGWLSLIWKRLLAQKKQLMLGGAGVVLLGGVAYYFLGAQSSAPQYMTAKVERGNLRNTVTATGTLQAVTTVQVGSQSSGTLSGLYADFNSVVKKGQVIAQLDPSVSKAQVDQSRANLQQARAALQQSIASVAGSRAGVSDAQAKALAARSTVQNNQSGVSSAQANLAVLKAQLDDGMAFLKQQASDVGDQWTTFFRGKHLIYLYTSGGFTERRDIYLCRSGAFFSRNDSSSLSSNGSGAVASNSDGSWKTSSRGGAKLILEYRNGAVREYRVSRRQAANEIDLNGSRYFVEANNECP